MSVNITQCDECGERVAIPDNGVRLDYPATKHDPEAYDRMTIMTLGSMDLACSVPPSAELSHTLHKHQPEES